MNIEDRYKEINNALLMWNFDEACRYHDALLEHSFKYFSDYIKLLADFGKLERIHYLFDKYGFIFIEEKIHDPQQKNSEAIAFCLKFIKEKFIPSQFSLIGSDKNARLLHLSLKGNKSELAKYIETNTSAIINNNSTAQDNMILNFAINHLIAENLLSGEIGIRMATTLIENKNINSWRKKFLLSSILKYFHSKENCNFFKLKDQYYNHIQKIAFQLNNFFHEIGAKRAYYKFNNAILTSNNTNLNYFNKKEPKIAVCISGMFRGNSLAIDSIKNNIIHPLNADVFIHSWDTWQPWPGICGGAPDSWIWRLFGGDGKKLCPNSLKSFLDFKKYFPTAAKVIETPVTAAFTPDFMTSIIQPTSFKIDNELEFIKSLGEKSDVFSTRGNHNQAKMFYGISASTELMTTYEKEQNFEYDYVIRARPDCAIIDKLPKEFIDSLNFNELATDMILDCGPLDQFYISRRDVHIKIANLWKASVACERLSPFENFPKYDAHALMFLWMVVNNIIPVTPPVKRHLALATSNACPPKDLYDALKYDLQHTAKGLYNSDDIKKFIDYLLEINK